MTDDDGLEALLDGVWQRRRAQLLERADELLATVDAVTAGDPSAWERLGAHAHRMSGALGTLGFDELARTAVAVEREVNAGPRPSTSLLARLRDDLGALRAALLSVQERPRG